MAEFNYQNRRDFVKSMFGAAFVLGGVNLLPAATLSKKGISKLTILYTNDTHSRIDPFPDNDPKFPGLGGAAKRAAVIKKIRSEEPNVLLLDAGDIFQGTPYFNVYGGELEYRLMTEMGYDATTLGNHDFDRGIEGITDNIKHAKFDFICANYDVSETALNDIVKPYKIYHKAGLKIGVVGVGIDPDGLIDKKLCKGVKYHDPITVANGIAKNLKKEQKCDYVICLSHLGYKYEGGKVGDVDFAKRSQYIDLIIGAHTHTFLEKPLVFPNVDKTETMITQVGWAGIWLGRIDVFFSHNNKKLSNETAYIKIINKQV